MKNHGVSISLLFCITTMWNAQVAAQNLKGFEKKVLKDHARQVSSVGLSTDGMMMVRWYTDGTQMVR